MNESVQKSVDKSEENASDLNVTRFFQCIEKGCSTYVNDLFKQCQRTIKH